MALELSSHPDILKLIVAAILGATLGLEREIAGKDPSLRTFTLICLGSCLFTMVSTHSAIDNQFADPARISAQIVSGIGFLGAGAIFRSKRGVSGLTTAALMWLAAAVGIAVGLGLLELAVSASLLGLLVMVILKLVHKFIRYMRPDFYSNATDFD